MWQQTGKSEVRWGAQWRELVIWNSERTWVWDERESESPEVISGLRLWLCKWEKRQWNGKSLRLALWNSRNRGANNISDYSQNSQFQPEPSFFPPFVLDWHSNLDHLTLYTQINQICMTSTGPRSLTLPAADIAEERESEKPQRALKNLNGVKESGEEEKNRSFLLLDKEIHLRSLFSLLLPHNRLSLLLLSPYPTHLPQYPSNLNYLTQTQARDSSQ